METKLSFFILLSFDSSKTRFNLRLFIFLSLSPRNVEERRIDVSEIWFEGRKVCGKYYVLYEYSLVINFKKGKKNVFLPVFDQIIGFYHLLSFNISCITITKLWLLRGYVMLFIMNVPNFPLHLVHVIPGFDDPLAKK